MLKKDVYFRLLKQAEERAIAVYRELHMYPETGNKEYKTAQLIENNMQAMGFNTERPLPTTITALQSTLKESRDRKQILIRADIDGLNICEETSLSYKSKNEGYMHACGHDVHTAVLIGFAYMTREMERYSVSQ